MWGRRGPKARSDAKWKDEHQRWEDEGRRPKVTLSGRMSLNWGRRGPKARANTHLKGSERAEGPS